MTAAKRIILALCLVVAVIANASAFAPLAPENRVWENFAAPPETRPATAAQLPQPHQENALAAYDFAPESLLAAKGAPKIGNAVNAVEDFLGGQGKIIRNADGDTILMRGDKKIRFDIQDPHGDKPHFHLEQQTPGGKWKDAGPEHRYYFSE